MPFQQDIGLADGVGLTYGKYHSTFYSQTGQVMAHLFEQSGRLIAHISFPTHLDPEDVTDAYGGELNNYAHEHGFDGKLRIIYSE